MIASDTDLHFSWSGGRVGYLALQSDPKWVVGNNSWIVSCFVEKVLSLHRVSAKAAHSLVLLDVKIPKWHRLFKMNDF